MNGLVILGFIGQAAFFMRFLVQWVASEKRGESFIPIYFWYLSIGGGLILLVYAIQIGDPVFTLGQSCGVIVYIRNIMLICKNNKKVAQQHVS
ncbi:MAG: lipid-A-disaccharide synthase N-terminal domain-containing protein [Deltaproteobacteria bacterium]|nr:lipid-A-disaccharide synthase N-terminal domain-containing protein [Pseudomonadota bacterium]MCK5008989.1 lipid-A-disaccharide synthase N-terminal domain-containing protein [Deltaproteobacteria bacterium]